MEKKSFTVPNREERQGIGLKTGTRCAVVQAGLSVNNGCALDGKRDGLGDTVERLTLNHAARTIHKNV